MNIFATLSVSVPLYVSVGVCLFLVHYLSVFVGLCVSLYLYVSLSLFLSLSLRLCPFCLSFLALLSIKC